MVTFIWPGLTVNTAGLATSANQASQITLETSANTKLDTLHTDLGAVETKLDTLHTDLTNVETKQDTGNTSLSSIDTKTPALGQALAAASVPVVLTAAQLSTLTPLTTVAATQSGTWNVTNVSGTVSLPTGAATSANQTTANNSLASIDGKITAVNTGAVVVSSSALPTGAATSANQTTANTSLSSIDTKVPALGQALAAASVPVVLTASQLSTLTPLATVASTQSGTWTVQPGNTANTTAWLVTQDKAATSTITSVASSASSVSLLASNANRKNATFFNDSTQIAYLKLGATASNTSYTVQLSAGGYYELPVGRIYTGAIDCIWASANGNMRITELT